MWLAIGKVVLHLPQARGLKDKRRVLRHLQDRAHARWRVSFTEVEAQDQHRRAVLGFAAVTADRGTAEHLADRLRSMCEDVVEAQVVDWQERIEREMS